MPMTATMSIASRRNELRDVYKRQAYTRVLADFEYLLKEVIAVKEAAEEKKNYLVSTLMDDYLSLIHI